MADMTQPATLGNLQRVVENMKVYVDSDKTTSIKGYLKKNNTHNFYNTSTPTEDTTPIFSFDVATEYFLDQTKTTFVQNFEWSDAIYTGSTNPNLDGKPVFVLAVKGDDMVSYSFVNLETLVDTYKTKNTTTLSLDITDNEISGNVNISTEDGNAVVVKDDGLYVTTTAEIKVSETDGNIIEVKDDGIYVAPTDLNEYAKTEDIPTVTNDLTDELKAQYDKAEENVQSDWNETDETSDAFIKNKPTIPSTDGLATTEYVDNAVSNVTVDTSNLVTDEGLAATLSDYAKSADITEYDDTEVKESIANLTDTKADKAELDAYVTDTELTDKGYATETFVTNKIAEAQLDGSDIDLTGLATKDELALKADKTEIPDLSGYALKTEIPSTDGLVTEENLSTTLADYVADEELSTALADYTTTSEADEKYVLDEEITVMSESDVLALIGLSDTELEGLNQILVDTSIVTNKTWSSSKIYSELNTTLDSAKQYTLDELSKAIGASYKVVTSVDQMTDSKVLYLLKDADSGMYNIYVYDADTSTAELIGSFEINLDDYLKISDAEAQYVKQTDLVANYATKQEVVDGYATKTELQDAIADVEVEISETENNQIQTLDDGLFVGSETITISKADYDALSIEEKSNGKTYFVPDDETTEDGTDLTQFAKVSDLEETNNKIEEINTDLGKKLSLSGGEMSGGIEMKGNTIGSVGDIFLNDKGAFLNALLTNINNNLAQLIKTTTVTVSADISANSSVFMNVSPPKTPSGYRDLFAFIQGGSGSIDTSQLLVGSGTTGCRVYNNLPQKQTVTIECRIVYIKNC